jgi:hypothetical protein
VLGAHLFEGLIQVREIIGARLQRHNDEPQHESKRLVAHSLLPPSESMERMVRMV